MTELGELVENPVVRSRTFDEDTDYLDECLEDAEIALDDDAPDLPSPPNSIMLDGLDIMNIEETKLVGESTIGSVDDGGTVDLLMSTLDHEHADEGSLREEPC